MTWYISGNNIDPTKNYFLGTTNNQPLVIKTNQLADDSEKVRVNPDGNVGIGKAPGTYKLDVVGAINASEVSKGGSPLVSSQWTDASGGISYTGGNVGIAKSPSATYKLDVAGTINVAEIHKNGAPLSVSQWTDVSGGINYAGGRVGIGTTGRLSRNLHVQGSEIHTGGAGAGYSFGNREAAKFVEIPGDGERWVWYASGGRARLWSGADKLAVALDPTVQAAVIVGPGTNGRLKVRHIDGKHWLNDDNDGLYLNWDTGQPVNVGQNLAVAGNAFKPGGGWWSVASDVRLKEGVTTLKGALDKLLRLRGVTFEWKEPEKHANLRGPQMGLIAQEVEGVFPEWIDAGPEGHKYLTVRGFEALAVEAFRELKAELEAVRAALGKE